MKKYFKLRWIEVKSLFYGMLMGHYNNKILRHQYNIDKSAAYAKKKYNCKLDYKKEMKKK